MERDEIEHVIRAAGEVLGEDVVIVVGSQAVLGKHPVGLPRDVRLSGEADVAALDDPDDSKAMLINGVLGEGSRFEETHGYYVEGVSIELPRFPRGWRERVTPVTNENTNGVTGLCPDPHDICIAKLLCRREKDAEFTNSLLQSGHVKGLRLLELLDESNITAEERRYLIGMISRLAKPGRNSPLRRAIKQARRAIPAEATSPGYVASALERDVGLERLASTRAAGPPKAERWFTARKGRVSHRVRRIEGQQVTTACGKQFAMDAAVSTRLTKRECATCAKGARS